MSRENEVEEAPRLLGGVHQVTMKSAKALKAEVLMPIEGDALGASDFSLDDISVAMFESVIKNVMTNAPNGTGNVKANVLFNIAMSHIENGREQQPQASEAVGNQEHQLPLAAVK